MPYTLIRGGFHIYSAVDPRSGPEPDGDTIQFRPDNPDLVAALPGDGGARAAWKGKERVSLRLEGIDALELHFLAGGAMIRQNLAWARAARDHLLAQLGFGRVEWQKDRPFKVAAVANHPAPGYILAQGCDRYGRVISFAFAGQPTGADGTRVWLDEALLAQSTNCSLVRAGLAYPAFYSTLPPEVREWLAASTTAARREQAGFWPVATAEEGHYAVVRDLAGLQELVMWPKLFRRLATYLGTGGRDLRQFLGWLKQDPRDRDDFVLLPNQEVGNLHDVIEVIDNRIRLTMRPEELVMLPDSFAEGAVAPAAVMGASEAPVVSTKIGVDDVRILAAVVDPIGPDAGRETVTLMNVGTRDVDLRGWYLEDRSAQRRALDGPLPAGETRRYLLGGALQLGNRGDSLSLRDPSATLIHEVRYTAADLPGPGRTLVFAPTP